MRWTDVPRCCRAHWLPRSRLQGIAWRTFARIPLCIGTASGLVLPNTQEILRQVSTARANIFGSSTLVTWRPNWIWVIGLGSMLIAVLWYELLSVFPILIW